MSIEFFSSLSVACCLMLLIFCSKTSNYYSLFHFCKFILQTYICMFSRIVGLYHYSFMLMWWSTFGYLWGRAGTTTQEGFFFFLFPIYCFCLQNVHSVLSFLQIYVEVIGKCWHLLFFLLISGFYPCLIEYASSAAVFCFSERTLWLLLEYWY